MNEEKNVISTLTMKDLYFEKIVFERGVELPTEIRTGFKTDYNSKDDNIIEVKLICSIKTNTSVSIDITLVGVFENNEQDAELKEDLNRINTVSIMFPYLRAELSLITAQPNFPTIDLPVFNINELLRLNGEIVGTINNQ